MRIRSLKIDVLLEAKTPGAKTSLELVRTLLTEAFRYKIVIPYVSRNQDPPVSAISDFADGLVGVYRKFIENEAALLQPLFTVTSAVVTLYREEKSGKRVEFFSVDLLTGNTSRP